MTPERMTDFVNYAKSAIRSDAAEIDRLRKALLRIAETNPPSIAYAKYKDAAAAYWAAFDRCREIARAALEPKP